MPSPEGKPSPYDWVPRPDVDGFTDITPQPHLYRVDTQHPSQGFKKESPGWTDVSEVHEPAVNLHEAALDQAEADRADRVKKAQDALTNIEP